MLSRVANSIHWMSRYIERAENIARFVDVVQRLLLDLPDASGTEWEALISATGDKDAFTASHGDANERNVIEFLTFDRENPNSMASCLFAARENARSIREVISSEMWEQINRSYWMLRDAQSTERIKDDPEAFFSHFKKACHLLIGITDTTMSHGDAWHFARLGRLLERADKTSRILDVKYFMLLPRVDYVGSPYDSLQWAALLRCSSALEMYRKRHHHLTPEHVAEFLLLDRDFPRSVRFCLAASEESIRDITGSAPGTFCNTAEQKLGRLRADFDYTSIDEIIQQGLHEYLDTFQLRLNDVGAAIHDSFFAVRHAAAGA